MGTTRAASVDLSDRQHVCLTQAGKGLSSKEIGRLLGISPSTVDNHIHAAITKLQAKNRWHAAQLIDPNRSNEDLGVEFGDALLPPFGGRPNMAPAKRRLVEIVTIAATSLIAVTAAITLILGALHVFGTP